MGVLAVCDKGGYVISSCRCPQQHAVRELPCDHKSHEGVQRFDDKLEPKGKRR